MKKRLFSIFLTLCMVLTLLPAMSVPAQAADTPCGCASAGAFTTGSGLSADPWIISTADELDHVREHLGAHYKLDNDIALNTWSGMDDTLGWDPIGDYYFPFTGTFDGNGHKVTGLWIDRPNEEEIGLFGEIYGSGAKVKNLGVEIADQGITGETWAGGLAGLIEYAAIENCYVTGSGLVTVTAPFTATVGGLVGTNFDGSIKNCFTSVAVTGKNATLYTGSWVGGIAGMNDGTIENCYAVGEITVGERLGAIVGSNGTFGTITGCFFDADTSGLSDGVGYDDNTTTPAQVYGKTTAEMKTAATFSGWDFTDTWYIDEGNGYPVLQSFLPPPIPDTTPPTVISVTLAGAGATLSGDIVITFDEPMDQTAIGTVELSGVGPLTGGTWTSTTVYTVPYSGLDDEMTYAVTIAGFKDLAGNIMDTDDNNTFTTAAAPTTYTVTFNPNGGSVTPTSAATGTDGTLTSLPVPTRYQYTFTGWFDATSGGTRITTSTVFSANRTIFAQWMYSGIGTQPISPTDPVSSTDPDDWNNPYIDVNITDWFYEAVRFVSTEGLMIGTSSNMFSPNEPMTRAMMVTVLYRLEGEPAVSGNMPFLDVKAGEWYSDAILWASKDDLVLGYGNGNFGPFDHITREQAMTILYRYAQSKGLDVSAAGDLSGYTDMKDISDWALPAMKWAVAEGIMQGRTPTTTVPQGTSTRAELAMILMRFL